MSSETLQISKKTTNEMLGHNIPASQKFYRSFLSGNFANSLFFEEISEQEVINLCSSLRSGTATRFDNVPMSLIKEAIINPYF